MHLSLFVDDGGFVFIDVLEGLLVLHELVVVLLVDRIFLGLDLVSKQHFLIVLFLLSLPFLFFSPSFLFPKGQLLKGCFFLFFHGLFFPEVVFFEAPAGVLVHEPFLFDGSSSFFLKLFPFLVALLDVLST